MNCIASAELWGKEAICMVYCQNLCEVEANSVPLRLLLKQCRLAASVSANTLL